jgi:hypothetical protein
MFGYMFRLLNSHHQAFLKMLYKHFNFRHLFRSFMMVKGKAAFVQAWTGPEGSRRLGLPDF